jgi:hypothetical protein
VAQPDEDLEVEFKNTIATLCKLMNRAKKQGLQLAWSIQATTPKAPYRVVHLAITQLFIDADGKEVKRG